MNRLVKLCLLPALLLASLAMTSTASAGHHHHHHHHTHKHHFGHFHAHKVIVPVHVPKVIVVPSFVPVYKHCHGGFCY
jgi:hypothetical protein